MPEQNQNRPVRVFPGLSPWKACRVPANARRLYTLVRPRCCNTDEVRPLVGLDVVLALVCPVWLVFRRRAAADRAIDVTVFHPLAPLDAGGAPLALDCFLRPPHDILPLARAQNRREGRGEAGLLQQE